MLAAILVATAILNLATLELGSSSDAHALAALSGLELAVAVFVLIPRTTRAACLVIAGVAIGSGLAGILGGSSDRPCACLGAVKCTESGSLVLKGSVITLAGLVLAGSSRPTTSENINIKEA